MLYLGFSIFFLKSGKELKSEKGNCWISAFLLTMANPATILSFLALILSRGVGMGKSDWMSEGVLALGIGLGSLVWWILWANFISWMGSQLKPKSLIWLNRVAGFVFLAFAVACFL